MTVRYYLDEEYTMVVDVACEAIWAAYELGRNKPGQELHMVGFSGCERLKNFYIELDVRESGV